MLSDDRHQKILKLLDEQGSVRINELVTLFDISEMTVRRDLAILERKALLSRVYGGAVSTRGRSYEPPYLARSSKNLEKKIRIGKAAAAQVIDGDSIGLDIGTTTLEVARNLVDRHNLTIITPSFIIAQLLSEQAGIRLILTGGILRPGELSLVGNLAERVFQEFFIDKLFLGVGAIDIKNGLSEFNMEDTLVKRAMVNSAKEIFVVTDSSKFNQVAFTQIAPLKAIQHIITDTDLDADTAAHLREEGIDVMLV
jgi:DeoR/GlpR family transcriptional regulator of sugar metabolism